MDNTEMQEEEKEVLLSIYEGDENFKEIGDLGFQYKIGESDSYKSFLLEISWGEEYPSAAPTINLDAFYNNHLLPEVKEAIKEKLSEQVEDLLETAMTYTLFEFAKENADELLADQPVAPIATSQESTTRVEATQAKVKEKKEQLTKAQKRKITNRMDNKGEMPRGYDWVDVIKHLSQTGRGKDT
ncbi:hypothetical protein CAPTEDRAFT_162406 [Capitella teleta]|uniref:RWD domain-containing protein n=1 Tax=Capitella teleta TaxID=283909 RepID=R7URW5_CAPTE|nr:hypothetical protein CAPTEDRAFT_20141 [Capitella teleta]ELU09264.1 hypothetical protein CAPTEDRAFT_162406 [Capitella teleta]|eukprot:ELU00560.1 hypothetical protein CAPTEDRAFT_20141 [Capitella teleta]